MNASIDQPSVGSSSPDSSRADSGYAASDRADSSHGREHRLTKLFRPRSIVLVGATEKSAWTGFIMQNLRDFAFDGYVCAVNRNGVDVMGVKGHRSCRDIGRDIDVAFIFVPQSAVIEALEDAAAAGIRNAAILTSGYAEIGEQGAVLQQQLLDKACELGMNIWGPNSLGYNNVSARTPVSSVPAVLPLLAPRIAIVSQSGATASELNEFAHSQNIGTSFVAATGNEAQLSLADVIDYLVDDEDTRAIAVFAESIRNPAVFAQAARRCRERRKPIVMLKIGRSELAGEVAKAHTGSLAGNDKVFDAICERLGVIRVHSVEDLIVTAGLLAATGPLPASGLGFISISGGACTLVADGAEAAGASVPAFPAETTAVLKTLIADFASSMNPLDVTGAAVRDPSLLERLIPVAAAAPGIGIVGVNIGVPTVEGAVALPAGLAAIGRAVKTIDKPAVMVLTTVKTLTDVTRRMIAEHDLPHVVCGIDPMLRAVAKAAWWSQRLAATSQPLLLPAANDRATAAGLDLSKTRSATPGRSNEPGATLVPRLSNERAVLDFLASHGVPVIPAKIIRSRADAQSLGMTGPLALKILSPDIAHKTEVGGVRLNVVAADAATAYDEILKAVKSHKPEVRIEGVIASPMRQGGVELLVGVRRDPTWGPTITIGLGGVLVELLADVAIAALPVEHREVLDMLSRLRGRKLLQGFRNSATTDLDRLADVIVNIGNAALALGPKLDSLEVNPLLVRGNEIEALDGLVIWRSVE
ncbi:acetate--CoA ligase family protein [Peristeroidobacter soli]|uniref:acetate--CoA ligase family protein n=1 Tax=Peristeroidobacter soli TaxID=2497877 RepID=UPI00158B6573|nr:acetate--CoA ligase family protein [Peristeroidobacter soli]